MKSSRYRARGRIIGTLLLCAAAIAFSGCHAPPPTPEQLNTGLIWMFPGAEGGEWLLHGPRRAFRDTGVDAAIYTHTWRYPLGMLPNLMHLKANTEDAVEVAQKIGEYHHQYPGRPIDLVGYSAGGAMAVMVAQRVPPDVRLRHVILIHAAISCNYDLTAALSHVDGKLLNFYSSRDWLMVGLGTWLFGTVDRVHTVSAGKDGFDPDLAIPDPNLRDRFEQIPWSSKMIRDGHLGGHATIRAYDGTRKYIAPYLLSQPN